MAKIKKIWYKFLIGIMTLLISNVGTLPSSVNDKESNSEDNDSDYHLFI